MIKSERVTIQAAPLPADNNIRRQYTIHDGQWIKHPQQDRDHPSFCRFTLAFTLDQPACIVVHLSADNRFELQCDGQFVGMGPDRSDIEHWSFHSYRLELEAGSHELAADVHYLGVGSELRPCAQTCIEPGFIFVADDSPVDLNTGSAPWRVTMLRGVGTHRLDLRTYMVVGPNYTIDAAQYFNPPPAVEPLAIRRASAQGNTGVIAPGWKLHPTRMPEQTRIAVTGGRIRCVADIQADQPFPAEVDNPRDAQDTAAWQALITGQGAVTIPPRQRVVVLWDLEEYYTAYPELDVADGQGARIDLDWAEACHVNPLALDGVANKHKGNRNEIAGKYFRGNGDAFLPDGARRTLRACWWRAGRYVRITITTADDALTINRLRLLETRMPLENPSTFISSDDKLPAVIDIAVRGIQTCAHETYMDCPYYEQMMYAGDTRLQMLTSYVMSMEDRLNQRSLEIFDWSRQETGFVLERCPSQPSQLSCTFSMIWALMLRDHAWWRDEPAFIKARLKGLRCMLEEFKALPMTDAPLLPALPGWSFMDWVPGMVRVDRHEEQGIVSSATNLLFLNALLAAAELEETLGEAHLASYNRAWAQRLAKAIDEHFWVEGRGLFADGPSHDAFSEHAQCLALLSGMFEHRQQRCFESLVQAEDLKRTTVYFSFYLLETFAKFGRGDLILQKLSFWKELAAQGFKTPVETPEPSRSDCHAWGSHPLFHMHASLAGIRPEQPGFKRVRITPLPGSLTELRSTLPHPAGEVSLAMTRDGESWRAEVRLPAGVQGVLDWRGRSYPLADQWTGDLPAK